MKSLFDRLSEIKKQIFIDDHQIVCKYYSEVRSTLVELMNDVERQLVIVDEKLNEYGCSRYDPVDDTAVDTKDIDEVPEYDEKYNPKAQWSEKVEYILRKNNRPMTFTEITDAIVTHELTLGMNKKDKQKLRNVVRTSLGETMKKNSTDRARTPARFQRLDKTDNVNTYWLAGEDIPEGWGS